MADDSAGKKMEVETEAVKPEAAAEKKVAAAESLGVASAKKRAVVAKPRAKKKQDEEAKKKAEEEAKKKTAEAAQEKAAEEAKPQTEEGNADEEFADAEEGGEGEAEGDGAEVVADEEMADAKADDAKPANNDEEGADDTKKETKADAEEATAAKDGEAADEEKEEEVVEEDPPSEVEAGWEECAKFDAAWEDTEWLKEGDGKRLQQLEKLSGASVNVGSKGTTIRLKFSDTSSESDKKWAEQCMRATLASRSGTDIPIYPLPKPTPSSSSSFSVIDVPKACEAGFVKGKNGSRLLDLGDSFGVVPVFAVEGEKPAEVLEAEAIEAKKEKVWEVGMMVEAKYGASYADAELVEVGEEVIKVKWGFDGSEEKAIREYATLKEVPVEFLQTLIVYGGKPRARMEFELRILDIIQKKAPDSIPATAHHSIDNPELGWSVMHLGDKTTLGKYIGKGAAIKKKIIAVCGTSIEFIGESAHIVGSLAQRQLTEAVLDVVRSGENGRIPEVHERLSDMCTRVMVPPDAVAHVMGAKRSNMNNIEETSGVMTFTMVPAADSRKAPKETLKLAQDLPVEVKFRGQWVNATIAEVPADLEKDEEDETDGRTVKIKYVADGKEAEVPVSALREKLEGDALAERQERDVADASTTVVIIGSTSGRRQAELKVLALIEEKSPGTLTPSILASKYGLETQPLTQAEASRLQKDDIAARLNIVAAAANCAAIVTIGLNLCFSGASADCTCGKDYIKALLVEVPTAEQTEAMADEVYDTTMCPKEKTANLTATALEKIERDTSTFTFFDDGAELAGLEDEVRLIVCGSVAANREKAKAQLKVAEDVVSEADDWKGNSGYDEKKDWEADKSWNDPKGGEDSKKAAWSAAPADAWKESSRGWDEKKDDKKEASVCKDFQNGRCTRGDACKFSHADPPADDKWSAKADDWKQKEADDKWKRPDSRGSDNKWDAKTESSQEKRVHPSDKSGAGYTYEEFKAFAAKSGDKVETMWNASKPAGQDQKDNSSDKGKSWDKKDSSWGDKKDAAWDAKKSWDAPADGGDWKRARVDDKDKGTGSKPWEDSRKRETTDSRDDGDKRRRTDDRPSGRTSGSSRQEDDRRPAPRAARGRPSDPQKVLSKLKFPDSIDEWKDIQDKVWENHSPLPRGWIRIWSRSQKVEYYTRLKDNHSTFELDEVVG